MHVTSGPVVGSFERTRISLGAIVNLAKDRRMKKGTVWLVDAYMKTGQRCGGVGNTADKFWTEIGWRSRDLGMRRELWVEEGAISKECIQDYGMLTPKDAERYRYYHPADLDSIVYQMENESENEL